MAFDYIRMAIGKVEAEVRLIDAVIAAMAAGAQIEGPAHPLRLKWADVTPALREEAVTELMTADPVRMDQALSRWRGLNEHLERYRQALAAHDEAKMAEWRLRLLENYEYRGPFPDDPPMA
jgi:hypothetical protein